MKPKGSFYIWPRLLLLISLITSLSCGQNILSEFAKDDTDAALFKAARIHINSSEWDDAISKFSSMSAAYLAKREVAVVYASAYAGRCGLDLLALAESMAGTLPSLLFKFLMAQYKNVTTANRDDCKTAETIIKAISADAALRTVDENLLMAFLSFAKIGATISAHADKADFDGNPDGGWNACTDDAANFPEASVREVGTGLALALISLGAVGGQSTIGSGQLTSLTDLCNDLSGINPALDFCSITEAATYDANQVKGIRSIVQANEWVGIGSCNNTLDNCLCP
ncbi:MAG: hypothetical protein H6624_10465 [Bdellovibrionaceae bacterium]|nr:hypothetical protein [Bdellovibrionales bacterium]MCB9084758.1 hypothetical protein [Pseudobdellovibrionaceae bacterium]